jgi:hypothetical protein
MKDFFFWWMFIEGMKERKMNEITLRHIVMFFSFNVWMFSRHFKWCHVAKRSSFICCGITRCSFSFDCYLPIEKGAPRLGPYSSHRGTNFQRNITVAAIRVRVRVGRIGGKPHQNKIIRILEQCINQSRIMARINIDQ